MIKKLVPFVCLLVPFGAGATVYTPDDNGSVDGGLGLAATGVENIIIRNGNSLVLGANGLQVENDMFIGGTYNENAGGSFYAETGINPLFSIQSDGDITVDGALTIANGYQLGIKPVSDDANVSVNFGQNGGAIIADGGLVVENVAAFVSNGAIGSATKLDIQSNGVIRSGAIDVSGGDVLLNAGGDLDVAQLVVSGTGQTNLTGNSVAISVGDLQNGAGNMDVVATGGNVSVAGDVINNKNSLGITANAGDITIGGTIGNDTNGKINIVNARNLTVSGGNADNQSVVSKGDFIANVAEKTDFKYGINLENMATDKVFSLTTGQLDFSKISDATANDGWLNNNLNSYALNVARGDLVAGDIKNAVRGNLNAVMGVQAQNINVSSVENDGKKLSVKATTGDVTINGGITGNKNSKLTDVIANAGAVTVRDVVYNAGGEMNVGGRSVSVGAVSNNGDKLNIYGALDDAGIVNVDSTVTNGASTDNTNVTNTGVLNINARQIVIGGDITNYSGTMAIAGSDTDSSSINFNNSVYVYGGRTLLDALIGGIDITNSLGVSGGVLDFGAGTSKVSVGKSVQIYGDVNLTGNPSSGAGNVNFNSDGTPVLLTSKTGSIDIGGNVIATDSDAARGVQFDASSITVGQDVRIANKGNVIFGNENSVQRVSVTGDVAVNDGGRLDLFTMSSDVGALTGNGVFVAHGAQITANTGDILINTDLTFNNNVVSNDVTSGFFVSGPGALTLKSTNGGISVNDVDIVTGRALIMNAARDINIAGNVNNTGTLNLIANVGRVNIGNVERNAGTLTVNSATINAAGINNSGTLNLAATGDVIAADINNFGVALVDGANVNLENVVAESGVMNVKATKNINIDGISVTGGTLNVTAKQMNVDGIIDIKNGGNLYQGISSVGMFNILNDEMFVTARGLNITGDMVADSGNVMYHITDNVTIGGDIKVSDGAGVVLMTDAININDIDNRGSLIVASNDGMTAGTVMTSGALTMISGQGDINVTGVTLKDGTLELSGRGFVARGTRNNNLGEFNVSGNLYQQYNGLLASNDVNVLNSDYNITAGNIDLISIKQYNGRMNLNSSDIKIHGDIDATDLRIAANPSTNGLDVLVEGDVSGGVKFIGLEDMQIRGNYLFDDNSQINAFVSQDRPSAVSPYYWANVSLQDDKNLGVITNPDDARPMIDVNGEFIAKGDALSPWNKISTAADDNGLQNAQIGLVLNSMVDQGTAVWLLHADGGIKNIDSVQDEFTNIRNVDVKFCNADGSICYNYLDSVSVFNKTDDKLPAFVSVRDTNDDGQMDSLYVVFDPRFGGPAQVFRIQPIVANADNTSVADFQAAGGLDSMIASQVYKSGFYNRTPIEVIPIIFQNTNMAVVADELYKRMEYYNISRDGTGLVRFSHLFQVHEAEQILGDIVLNEHTNFRSFEDRMFDEFIWNRNRNLKKAWMDVDYGFTSQKVHSDGTVRGNRFNLSGGFDWQHSETLLLGLTGRVSYMYADGSDSMNLGYLPDQFVAGNVKTTVSDTDIGLGAYLMKILGHKTRVYGNAFLDMHLLDVDRTQNFVADINGDGTAFSLTSEWGLMHDWLNQYVVGNMYARIGYNTGFVVKEKSAGSDYMKLKSDGYLTLTPGYSLVFQKRIYPSAWFQMRPYASVGVEYDVLGAPDSIKYKFAAADSFTSYDVDIEPLWANIGAGIEFLSAMGAQLGLDYRYQYNADIQLHNIRISGSYRF